MPTGSRQLTRRSSTRFPRRAWAARRSLRACCWLSTARCPRRVCQAGGDADTDGRRSASDTPVRKPSPLRLHLPPPSLLATSVIGTSRGARAVQDVARATCLTRPCPLPSRPIVRLRAAPRPYRLHCQLTRPFPPSLVFISFGALALALALTLVAPGRHHHLRGGCRASRAKSPAGPASLAPPVEHCGGQQRRASCHPRHSFAGCRPDDAHAAAASAPSQQPHAGMMMSAAGGALACPATLGPNVWPSGGGRGAAGGPPPGYSSGTLQGAAAWRAIPGRPGGYPPVGGGGPPGYGSYPGGAPWGWRLSWWTT